MKDSLKDAIENLVTSSVRDFRQRCPKRIIVTVSADRNKENPLQRGYRDATEIMSHTENLFLNQQFVSEQHIRIEKVPIYRKDRHYHEGDYLIYVLDWLDTCYPNAF